jgi:hypothetical protein
MTMLVFTGSLINELNVVAKWLTLLLCIWEILSSNLGLETSYPD